MRAAPSPSTSGSVIVQAFDNPALGLDNNKQSFEDLLVSSNLPPPGPAYYAARRALWLTPCTQQLEAARQVGPSTSRQRLENLLNLPGAVNDEGVWKSGVEKVWKGLTAGGRLKRRLPLAIVVKIIHAAWLRDPSTWPPGAIAPESDVETLLVEPSSAPAESSPSTTSPWMPCSGTIGQMPDREHASGLVVAAER